MNKKRIKRVVATSVSTMILGTMLTISGITNLKVYAADNSTNNYEKKVGAGEITGKLKWKENINYDYDSDGKDEEYLVIKVTNNSGVNDISFFVDKNSDEGKEVEKITFGQMITVNYVTGTPINFENGSAFPLSSVTQIAIYDMSGTLKSRVSVNYDYDKDGKNEEYLVITVADNSNAKDSSYFINKSTYESQFIEKIIIGQSITVNFTLGTPINFENKSAFPLDYVMHTPLEEFSCESGILKSVVTINYDYDKDGKNEEYLVFTVKERSSWGGGDK